MQNIILSHNTKKERKDRMQAIKGVYEDGQIKLIDPFPVKFEKKLDVLIIIPEIQTPLNKTNKKIKPNNFSFKRSREALKDYKGNLSNAVIEERRSYL